MSNSIDENAQSSSVQSPSNSPTFPLPTRTRSDFDIPSPTRKTTGTEVKKRVSFADCRGFRLTEVRKRILGTEKSLKSIFKEMMLG